MSVTWIFFENPTGIIKARTSLDGVTFASAFSVARGTRPRVHTHADGKITLVYERHGATFLREFSGINGTANDNSGDASFTPREFLGTGQGVAGAGIPAAIGSLYVSTLELFDGVLSAHVVFRPPVSPPAYVSGYGVLRSAKGVVDLSPDEFFYEEQILDPNLMTNPFYKFAFQEIYANGKRSPFSSPPQWAHYLDNSRFWEQLDYFERNETLRSRRSAEGGVFSGLTENQSFRVTAIPDHLMSTHLHVSANHWDRITETIQHASPNFDVARAL